MRPGNRIELTTDEGTATYEVRATIVVDPPDISVLAADFWANRGVGAFADALTLTTTDPSTAVPPGWSVLELNRAMQGVRSMADGACV